MKRPVSTSSSRASAWPALLLFCGLSVLAVPFEITTSTGAPGLGCLPARFATCRSNDDCKDEKVHKTCFDARCVECHYDTDCAEGSFCERNTSVCTSLAGHGRPDHSAPTVDDAGPAKGGGEPAQPDPG